MPKQLRMFCFIGVVLLQACVVDSQGPSSQSKPSASDNWVPLSSYDLPPQGLAPELGYDAAVVACLKNCQETRTEMSSAGLDALRQCGCQCLDGKVPAHKKFCKTAVAGLIQGSNADTLNDLRPKDSDS